MSVALDPGSDVVFASLMHSRAFSREYSKRTATPPHIPPQFTVILPSDTPKSRRRMADFRPVLRLGLSERKGNNSRENSGRSRWCATPAGLRYGASQPVGVTDTPITIFFMVHSHLA